MRELSDVYESARINIPLRVFPERNRVPSWDDLDERVRSELEVLKKMVMSVLAADELLLTNHHRVIGEFNRGVREGFFSEPGGDIVAVAGNELSLGPFQWGRAVGVRTSHGADSDPALFKQFITATHLLAHEFGQLDQAYAHPYDFLIRNIGPERTDEFGELVFALPILLNYRRPLIKDIAERSDFAFEEYYATQSAAPSHLEYLSHALVALLDPSEGSWRRVAANIGLATLPFKDGDTMQSEHFQAPLQAATTIFGKPIAACTVVRRQMARIELARNWIGSDWNAIELEHHRDEPVTLWDVYQSTAAASIRGQNAYFGDLVASNVVSMLSQYCEGAIGSEDTRFGFLRRHLPAFIRGFDAHSEGAVDPRALSSAGKGRSISDGLRRFEEGGLYIGAVANTLKELLGTLNELSHALENPETFVCNQIEAIEETPIAAHLGELFHSHPSLVTELFSENAEYEFFSRTQIQTGSPYDLMRRVLFHLTQAVKPTLESPAEVDSLLASARGSLDRLVKLGETDAGGPRAQHVAREHGGDANEITLVLDSAALFDEQFDLLTRMLRQLTYPLYLARMLGQPQSVFGPGYLDGLSRQGISGGT